MTPHPHPAPAPIERWRVLKITFRDKPTSVRVVGYSPMEDAPVITGTVKAYDRGTLCVTTDNGFLYRLSGEQGGYSRDVDETWTKWCRRYRAVGIEDISKRYLPKVKSKVGVEAK